MKRLGFFVTSCAIALTALPAIAQQSPAPVDPNPIGPGQGYGDGHMWGGGGWHHPGLWGWHHTGMTIIGAIACLLILIGLVALVVWCVRGCRHGAHFGHRGCPHCGYGRGRAALDIIEERFAKGEIDKNEFEEKRKLLGR